MANYNPPTESLTQFNSGVFNAVSGSTGLTISQGDLRYLRFPLGQGAETLPSVSVSGTATMGTANITGTASIGGTTTMSGDITLNEASGQQTITCSAPSGLNISTNVNTAPISFTAQSSSGTYTDILKIQANDNPRVIIKSTEAQFVSYSTPTQVGMIVNNSSGINLRCTASSGSGGVILDATTSTVGAGAITLATKNGTPSTTTGLILTGTALTSGTAGAHGGQHLCLTINGTQYKIALLAP